jgi:hypothetical protein
MELPEEATDSITIPAQAQPIRLSAIHAEIIDAGLQWIVSGYRTWREKRVMPSARVELRLDAGRFDRGEYSQELMQQLLALLDSVGEIRVGGGRLYDLSPFQIACLIFAVRVAAQRVRHGHTATTIRSFGPRATRLIASLEKHRKRAKRLFIVLHGAEQYRVREHQWQRFVRWLRVHFLDCACTRRPAAQQFWP